MIASAIEDVRFMYGDILMLTKIQNKQPLAFIRIGDGEIEVMNNINIEGRDKSFYFLDMGIALEESVKLCWYDVNVFIGLQSAKVIERYDYEIKMWMNQNGWKRERFMDADIFHKMSVDGKFMEWFNNLCDTRKVLIVGKQALRKVAGKFDMVVTPEVNCWLYYDQIVKQIKDTDHDVVLFACSAPAKIMICNLWKENNTRTYLDVGSVLDPYAGISTRRYHKEIVERENKKAEQGVCDSVKVQ